MEPIGGTQTLLRFSNSGGQTFRGPAPRWYIGGEPLFSTFSSPALGGSPNAPAPSIRVAGRRAVAAGSDGEAIAPAGAAVLGLLGRLVIEGVCAGPPGASGAGTDGPAVCAWTANATTVASEARMTRGSICRGC
jgi:hypothetical protein